MRCQLFSYITCIRKAVVCGGILAVWKFAWVILTICPGLRKRRFTGIPERFKMTVSSVMTNLV